MKSNKYDAKKRVLVLLLSTAVVLIFPLAFSIYLILGLILRIGYSIFTKERGDSLNSNQPDGKMLDFFLDVLTWPQFVLFAGVKRSFFIFGVGAGAMYLLLIVISQAALYKDIQPDTVELYREFTLARSTLLSSSDKHELISRIENTMELKDVYWLHKRILEACGENVEVDSLSQMLSISMLGMMRFVPVLEQTLIHTEAKAFAAKTC